MPKISKKDQIPEVWKNPRTEEPKKDGFYLTAETFPGGIKTKINIGLWCNGKWSFIEKSEPVDHRVDAYAPMFGLPSWVTYHNLYAKDV